jgi:hypothetical protein
MLCRQYYRLSLANALSCLLSRGVGLTVVEDIASEGKPNWNKYTTINNVVTVLRMHSDRLLNVFGVTFHTEFKWNESRSVVDA